MKNQARNLKKRSAYYWFLKFGASLVLGACTLEALSQVIPSSRLIPWVPGSTVGLLTPIPSRTNVIDVTRAPYNADSNGVTECSASINSALAAAAGTTTNVVYMPAGVYNVSGGIVFNQNNVTLRGAGPTNTILVGSMVASVEQSGNYPIGYAIAVASGTTKGSTNLTFVSAQDTNGSRIVPGDSFRIASIITSDATNSGFDYISSAANEIGESKSYALSQTVYILSVSGNTCTFTPPLVWNFTNDPVAFPQNLVGYFPLQMRFGIGMENFCLQSTNATIVTGATTLCQAEMMYNSWITNCMFLNGHNYNLDVSDCINCLFAHNRCSYSQGSGSDHAGMITRNNSGCLIEDNQLTDGLQPGLEWNDGFNGNAVFGNFFTNNIGGADIDMHNSHMVMNLWEENKATGYEIDGYFGSCSHQTLFRNQFQGTVAWKRWTTFCNAVGNAIGNTQFSFTYFPAAVEANYDQVTGKFACFEIGWPNIGSTDMTGISGPVPYNFPGWQAIAFSGDFVPVITNGYFVITNTQANTNVITGNFTNLWGATNANIPVFYHLLGQDPVNTNTYWIIGTPTTAPTVSNVTLQANTTVSNGWRVFISHQQCYQQQQSSNVFTDIITGNAVITNQSSYVTVWDANGVQSIPNSLLYTNGAPNYWGTNRWPAIDPVSSPVVTMIPAEERYNGIPVGLGNSGGGGGGGSPPPNPGAGSGRATIIRAKIPLSP